MIVKTIPVTLFQQNARILNDPTTNRSVLVDPGGEVDRILAVLDQTESVVESIFLTHSHIDHAGGVVDILAALSKRQAELPQLLGSELEKVFRESISEQALMFGVSGKEFKNCPEPDVYLREGDFLHVGTEKLSLFFTPGHAPGHLVAYRQSAPLVVEHYEGSRKVMSKAFASPLLIAGDTLFAGSIGRTDLPMGNHQQLLRSIAEKILVLPDDTLVLSGHGPDTTVGRERKSNPFLQDR